jgi:hypothetical protein
VDGEGQLPVLLHGRPVHVGKRSLAVGVHHHDEVPRLKVRAVGRLEREAKRSLMTLSDTGRLRSRRRRTDRVVRTSSTVRAAATMPAAYAVLVTIGN